MLIYYNEHVSWASWILTSLYHVPQKSVILLNVVPAPSPAILSARSYEVPLQNPKFVVKSGSKTTLVSAVMWTMKGCSIPHSDCEQRL